MYLSCSKLSNVTRTELIQPQAFVVEDVKVHHFCEGDPEEETQSFKILCHI